MRSAALGGGKRLATTGRFAFMPHSAASVRQRRAGGREPRIGSLAPGSTAPYKSRRAKKKFARLAALGEISEKTKSKEVRE